MAESVCASECAVTAMFNLIYADLSLLKKKAQEFQVTNPTDKETGWTTRGWTTSVDTSKVKFEVATTCMCWRCIFGGNEHTKASSSEHLEESDKDLKVLEAKINKAVVSSVEKLLSFQYYNQKELHEKSSGKDDEYVISEDWTSKFKKISTELVDYMAEELKGPVLNAAIEDPSPFQMHEVMTGDGGAVTLCITRGDRKPIYVENVLMQDAQAMFEVEDGLHTSHIGARLKEALDNALQRARCAVKGSLIIINVWDIGKQTSKEPNVHGVFKSDLWS